VTPTEELIAKAWKLVRAVESAPTMGAFNDDGAGPFLALYDRTGFRDKHLKGGSCIPGPGMITTPAKELRETLLRVEAILDAEARRSAP
jgi:hypothetical protein